MKNRSIFCRFLGFFCLALIALPFERAWGLPYNLLPSDRVLLMNNDDKLACRVVLQGYNDTNTTANTYWIHEGPQATGTLLAGSLQKGTNHTFYAKDGRKLWDLKSCRAGSAARLSAGRNFLPWTTTARGMDNSKPVQMNASGCLQAAMINMQNTIGACVYSPFYTNGIGSIYFDAVNGWTDSVTSAIDVQISTNALEGIAFEAETDYNQLEWISIPFDVLTVADSNIVTVVSRDVTELTLESTAGGTRLFYRVRSKLNYYGAIRFRIRRLSIHEGRGIDANALLMIDNVIASYPPMYASLIMKGEGFDQSLKGADVIGCIGDLSVPFLSRYQTNVLARTSVTFIRNEAVTTAIKLVNPAFHYRWRYLNQMVTDWQEIPMAETGEYDLVTSAGIDSFSEVGDMEYFVTTELDAPYSNVGRRNIC